MNQTVEMPEAAGTNYTATSISAAIAGIVLVSVNQTPDVAPDTSYVAPNTSYVAQQAPKPYVVPPIDHQRKKRPASVERRRSAHHNLKSDPVIGIEVESTYVPIPKGQDWMDVDFSDHSLDNKNAQATLRPSTDSQSKESQRRASRADKGGMTNLDFQKGSMAALLAVGEAGHRGYNSMNQGKAGNGGNVTLINMSLAELMKLQKLPRRHSKRIYAAGMYQITPITLRYCVHYTGISPTAKFDKKTQEYLFSKCLAGFRRKAIRDYVRGSSANASKAGIESAKEWRSIADPRTNRTYADAGSRGNRASISAAKWLRALNAARSEYRRQIANGASKDWAYSQSLHTGV